VSTGSNPENIRAPFATQAAPYLVFESRFYAVFFKPAGIHSVPLSKDDPKESLLSWVRVHYPLLESAYGSTDPGSRPGYLRAKTELGMLSRLDRETSGLIAFARSPEVFFAAIDSHRKTASMKRYLLLATKASGAKGLSGSRPLSIEFSEDDPFAEGRGFSVDSFFRSYGPRAARVACFLPGLEEGGKNIAGSGPYTTHIHPLPLGTLAPNLGAGDVSLAVAAEAAISKGFRHQIRAHMAWCGYPIWGDKLYGGADAPRLCLECHQLELENPQGELEKFELYESEWSDRD